MIVLKYICVTSIAVIVFLSMGLTGCAACATNKPLNNISIVQLPSKPEAIKHDEMSVGIKVVFDGNVPAFYFARRDVLRDSIVTHLNSSSGTGDIRFVPVDAFMLSPDADYTCELKCYLDEYENRKNKIGFAICAPASVSIMFTPIGITGLSWRGMVKEYSRFKWTACMADSDGKMVASPRTKMIEATVSATGWGTPERAMLDAFKNTESHVTDFASQAISNYRWGKLWAALDRNIVDTEKQSQNMSLASKPSQDSQNSGSYNQGKNITGQTSIGGVSNCYAVIVGLSQYQFAGSDGLTNLAFADDDAKDFASQLIAMGWSESHIKLLVNSQATQRNVGIALESWLTKAGPDDMVVLFWSGHGFPDPADPSRVYFACYDTEANIPATGYRMDKVRQAIEEVGCRNAIIFADTCHAGKIVTRGDADERAIGVSPYVKKIEQEKDVPSGWIFMVASESDRKAVENSSWSHGAFTHCLLEALSGKADGFQAVDACDSIISMKELRAYMSYQMPEITQKVLGVAKRPLIATDVADPDIWNLTIEAK